MLWVGFEPTITVFERVKTVHVLDGAAIVIGQQNDLTDQITNQKNGHQTIWRTKQSPNNLTTQQINQKSSSKSTNHAIS
jgi:hypothetical protein